MRCLVHCYFFLYPFFQKDRDFFMFLKSRSKEICGLKYFNLWVSHVPNKGTKVASRGENALRLYISNVADQAFHILRMLQSPSVKYTQQFLQTSSKLRGNVFSICPVITPDENRSIFNITYDEQRGFSRLQVGGAGPFLEVVNTAKKFSKSMTTILDKLGDTIVCRRPDCFEFNSMLAYADRCRKIIEGVVEDDVNEEIGEAKKTAIAAFDALISKIQNYFKTSEFHLIFSSFKKPDDTVLFNFFYRDGNKRSRKSFLTLFDQKYIGFVYMVGLSYTFFLADIIFF